MTSSTSPSEGTVPRLALLLVTVAVISYAASAAYSLYGNPEVRFWNASARAKLDWLAKIRGEGKPVTAVIGGSSTTFAVDPVRIDESAHIPFVNMGLHAGMGPEFLAGFAIAELRKGDTLLVSIEPALLCRDFEKPALGTQLAVVLGRMDMLDWRDPGSQIVSTLRALPDLRPGGYHTFTMLGKVAMRMPLYRYRVDEIRPGGFQVTSERRPMPSSSLPAKTPELSEDGKALLEALSGVAKARGIRIAYVLPWAYAPENIATEARALNSAFLDQVEKIMPVLREKGSGVLSDPGCFADTAQHLTEECAKARSENLAATIESWNKSAGKVP